MPTSRKACVTLALLFATVGLAACFRKKHDPDKQAVHLFVSRDHACAEMVSGKKVCWGASTPESERDDAASKNIEVPVSPAVQPSKILERASGDGFSCVLEVDRTVSCWGKNDCGQLGDGSFTDRSAPVRVQDLGGVHAIALGRAHACAVLHDWTLWCWGDNAHGELVDGTRLPSPRPKMIHGLFDVAEVGLGDGFTCARTNDRERSVRCWGRNDAGQAGDGTTGERNVPVFVRF